MAESGIGAALPRFEDARLLQGQGQYSDDFSHDGQTRAFVLRSPHPHARIVSIDAAAARKMPGVLLVLTGADVAAEGLKPIPHIPQAQSPPDMVGQGAPPTLGRVLLWHCNYHPDGGQFFWPLDGRPFVVPVAPPGEDVKPEDFVAFWSDGAHGIYIHPNIWHEGPFPVGPSGRYFDKQGKVHARISCDIAREFGVLLGVPLPAAV